MKSLIEVLVVLVFSIFCTKAALAVVVDFEDVGDGTSLSGGRYGGVYWELGSLGNYYGAQGAWTVYDSYYALGNKHVINRWGGAFMGISFLTPVDVAGAYFASTGYNGSYAVRVHYYLNGEQQGSTDWFEYAEGDYHLNWFDMSLSNVDRIVIESVGGVYDPYFAMDDLTYTSLSSIPLPAATWLFASGLLGLIGMARRK